MKRATIVIDGTTESLETCIAFVNSLVAENRFLTLECCHNESVESDRYFDTPDDDNSNCKTSRKGFGKDLICKRPFLFTEDKPFVYYAGLCTVVRKMVHHISESGTDKSKVKSLLVRNIVNPMQWNGWTRLNLIFLTQVSPPQSDSIFIHQFYDSSTVALIKTS